MGYEKVYYIWYQKGKVWNKWLVNLVIVMDNKPLLCYH
jgi:hypothetical protein